MKIQRPAVLCGHRRGCGQLPGVFRKCSDLIFANVPGILCAPGLGVLVERRIEHNQIATVFLGTNTV